MGYESFSRKGFSIETKKITDIPQTMYEVTIKKNGKSVSTVINEYAVEQNMENVMDDLYYKFYMRLKSDNREKRDKTVPCEYCSTMGKKRQRGGVQVCERCAIFYDY